MKRGQKILRFMSRKKSNRNPLQSSVKSNDSFYCQNEKRTEKFFERLVFLCHVRNRNPFAIKCQIERFVFIAKMKRGQKNFSNDSYFYVT